MKQATSSKLTGLILIVLFMLSFMPDMIKTVQAEDITIPNGNYTITADGVYQLPENYSGIITILSGASNVTVTDAVYKAEHIDTSIVIEHRTAALELTIEDINIAALFGMPGIDFGSAGMYENKLYISGTCSVAGSSGNAGIHVPDGAMLVIDKLNNNTSDQLTANGGEHGAAGIGGGEDEAGGVITINGGTVRANAGLLGAGIGGGRGKSGGIITINGGTVTAAGITGDDYWESGAGIGGGVGGAGGTITINGGTITAFGDFLGAGIGGGAGGDGGTISINEGTVTAIGKHSGAGIGGGNNGNGGTITIRGGMVTATGNAGLEYFGGLSFGIGAAGIGGGGSGSGGGIITISGGTVAANGNGHSAGIGGGIGTYNDTIITISGGTVTASSDLASHTGAAGIGSGSFNRGDCSITISGGTVTATSLSIARPGGAGIGSGGFSEVSGTITISGGIVTANSSKYGAGIGSGYEAARSTVTISGGTVNATGGENGAGIGGGYNYSGSGYMESAGAGGNIIITGTPVINATGDVANGAVHIGRGKDGPDSGTLKDEAGTDLSYLRFSTEGVPGAKVVLEGSNAPYFTNSQGIAGIFVPRSGSSPYTVSKGGYEAVRGTQAVSLMNHEINIPMEVDNTPSSVSGVTPLLLSKGTPLEVTFDDDYGIYGTLYLVPKAEVDYTSKEAIDVVTGAGIVVINSPAASESIDTEGLVQGTWQIYLADSAENVSEPSEDIVVDNLPEITAAEKAADDTYIDLVLSEGIFGAADGISELTKDRLQLIFAPNGGTAAGVTITSIKKNDEQEEAAATELQGGEAVVRVFIEVSGIPSGVETIEIKPADGGSIYDVAGHAMSEAQTTGAILLKDRKSPTVSNRNIVTSNITQTGTVLKWSKASDLATTGAELEYSVYQSAEDNLNTVEEIEAGGTLKQDYTADIGTFNITGLQPGSTYYFNVVVRDSASNKTYYNTASITTRVYSYGGGENSNDSKANEITIPIDALAGDAGKTIVVKTDFATITLPSNMFMIEDVRNVTFVTLNASRADTAKLSAEVQLQLGNRPAIELTLKLDGKTILWDNPDAQVIVSMPYKPSAEELADPENITVWYIDRAGNIISVPSGKYDPATGTVSFITTHFSTYAVVYVSKSFVDLGSVAWARKSVEVLSAKGILKGKTDMEYAPQEYITRADFLYYLIKTLNVETRVEGNFDDISNDAYYCKEIAIARKLGITSGTGNNKFSPDSRITRQDMMVLTQRALQMLKQLKHQGSASDLDKFADKSLVADYAIDSVAFVVKKGLIVGSGDRINPLGNSTRAETAVFLYRMYNEY